MKRTAALISTLSIFLGLIVACGAFSPGAARAADGSKEAGAQAGEQVKQAIESLIGYCRADDIAKAAPLVVYRGRDKARRWRDVSNVENMEDRIRVESACRQIKGLFEGSTGHQYVKFFTERESEGLFHIWQIRIKGATPREAIFAMLKIKGSFALADID